MTNISMRKPYHLNVLKERFGNRSVQAAYIVINGFITIALLATLALITRQPYLFPSLGPTAIILFATPTVAVAAPRNVILGHLIGVLAGYGALVLTDLTLDPPTFVAGVTGARVVAASLALAVTGGLTAWLDCQHPPAGATTLIIALGIMSRPATLVVLMGAVLLLVIQAIVINRMAGLPYPMWKTEASPGGR
ncbi:MAG TPA: HPP family protein [Symbiobacteriaceae bacterium]|nr:HPP family protein [Symbiobacteriaceae bacterium]